MSSPSPLPPLTSVPLCDAIATTDNDREGGASQDLPVESCQSTRHQPLRRRRLSLPLAVKKRGSDKDADEGVIAKLKKLQVTPLSECQKKKLRQQKQRDFRTRLKMAVASGTNSKSLASAGPPLSTQSRPLLLPGKLSPSLRSHSPASASTSFFPTGRRRSRHASDSSTASISPVKDLSFASVGAPSSSSLSSSLVDFSKCCSELETFTLDDNRKRRSERPVFMTIRPQRLDYEDEASGELPSPTTANAAAQDKSTSTTCAQQARKEYNDISVDDLAGYLEDSIVFPKKMSYMAEMMYT